jgi:hypothetical protein
MPAVSELWTAGIRKIKARGVVGDLRWRDLPAEYLVKGQIRLKVAKEAHLWSPYKDVFHPGYVVKNGYQGHKCGAVLLADRPVYPYQMNIQLKWLMHRYLRLILPHCPMWFSCSAIWYSDSFRYWKNFSELHIVMPCHPKYQPNLIIMRLGWYFGFKTERNVFPKVIEQSPIYRVYHSFYTLSVPFKAGLLCCCDPHMSCCHDAVGTYGTFFIYLTVTSVHQF